MFGTSIHWTTFFLLLINIFIIVFATSISSKLKHNNLNRYLILSILFIAYNTTGGFLPYQGFPGPFILQYIITYGVAIAMCVYVVYYLYREYDINFLRAHWSVLNITLYVVSCFLILFLLPYFVTDSLHLGRILFAVPVALICLYISWAFYKRISGVKNPNKFFLRRNKLSSISITCIALLPILTVIGDYQWLTFTIVNISFYTITAIEIDRYLYFLENKGKLSEVFDFYKDNKERFITPGFLNKGLTRREMEIALSILDHQNYRAIGDELFIAESTVSKHASNIFKKTEVKNRAEFIVRFTPKSIDF